MNAAIRRATVFALALVLVATGAALAQMDRFVPVTDEMLVNAADDPNNWLMWRRTYNHWGYSPLDQINRDNVASLQLVWARAMEPGLQETTPLVYNGIMYLVHSPDVVEALDATTGDLIWRYERELPEVYPPLAFANRNIAIYQDKIFLATADAALVALDARTGQVVWEQQVGDWTVGQHYSGGPMVVKGKVIAGMSGCYYINTRCFVTAHDPETGEELWRTYTIPAPGEPGDETWNGLPLELRYGGSAWMSASYDPELDLIFQGTAVPIQWTSAQRGTGDGDVLYTNSTLALDPDTGEIVWYYQHIPKEEWDLDHPFERIVVETVVAPDPSEVKWINPNVKPGERRKVVTGIPGKTGVVYTLDARTGEFLWARETVVQNVISTIRPDGYVLRNEDLVPDIGETVLVCPSLTGGRLWQSGAYSPVTNAMYFGLNNTCMEYTPRDTEPVIGQHHASARSVRIHVPGGSGLVGRVEAIDVATGRTLWKYEQRAPWTGALLATGGGLVFGGDEDRRFRAFDAETGEVLWEVILPNSANGFPITYAVDGVQYLAVPAGTGISYRAGLTPEVRPPSTGNMLLVFALPNRGK